MEATPERQSKPNKAHNTQRKQGWGYFENAIAVGAAIAAVVGVGILYVNGEAQAQQDYPELKKAIDNSDRYADYYGRIAVGKNILFQPDTIEFTHPKTDSNIDETCRVHYNRDQEGTLQFTSGYICTSTDPNIPKFDPTPTPTANITPVPTKNIIPSVMPTIYEGSNSGTPSATTKGGLSAY